MRPILNQAIGVASLDRRSRHAFWIIFAGAAAMLFMATAFGTVQNTVTFNGDFEAVVERIATPPAADEVTVAAPLHAREALIQRGDNLASILAKMDVGDAEAFQFLRTDPTAGVLARQLVPGRNLSARVSDDGMLHALTFPLSGEDRRALFVERTPDGFVANIHALDLDAKVALKSATIQHSLFGATDAAGIPDRIAVQLADIFGGDIDFHRDLRRGDSFSVIYETTSHQGKMVGSQRILAAEFINAGKTYQAFWHQPENGHGGGYYDAAGRSVKKAFLRSPLEFSRITSGFSNARYHPVLREIRAHRGIDFAAPTGTRVKVTSNGIVDFAGVQGGYGKVILVRHPGNITTVYGHLSRFAPGIRKGTRVSQGEVIGYVGATGIATGPHLHYEFRVNGVHRNPLTVALPDAVPLAPAQLPSFKASAGELATQLALVRGTQVAMLD